MRRSVTATQLLVLAAPSLKASAPRPESVTSSGTSPSATLNSNASAAQIPAATATTAAATSPTSVPSTSTTPAEKTSTLVSLSIAGGHGSSHSTGQQVVLYYSSLAGQSIRLLDFQPPGTFAGLFARASITARVSA